MSSTTDYTSLDPHHKFSIGGRSLSFFLLVVFFLVPQDTLALSVGDRVVVQNVGSIGLNVRTGAGTGYSVIGKVYDGAKGTITSGPRNANGYTWWKVRWNSSYHGWSVDYYDGDRLIFLDEPVKPSISSVGDDSATEGNTLRFTVRLSASTSQSETYYYSTYYGGNATAERGDYDGAAEESIRVSSGRSSFTIRIGTNEDADFDDETFYLYVTGEANHPNTTPGSSKYRGTGTIRDDDEPAVKPSISSVGDASATEGNTLSFTVTLSSSTSQTETYYYSTYYGGDATAERGDYAGVAEESIRVSSGQSSFTIRIDTNEDADSDDETFYLYVTGEANHPNTTPGSSKYRGTGTIRDNDKSVKPSISSVGDASATEGNTLSFTVTLSASTSQSETYYYSTYHGTPATAEVGDYDGAVDQSVQVSSGQSSFTIRISTYQDADGDDEIFFVHVAKNSGSGPDTNPNNTPGPSQYRGTGTIQDGDSPTTPTAPPTPLAPSGAYTYTFSLNNQTYTVASENRYTHILSANAKRAYIDGLRIYNSSNELIRPTNDILFQLTAAHASACVIDALDLPTILGGIDHEIYRAETYKSVLAQEADLNIQSHLLDTSIEGLESVIKQDVGGLLITALNFFGIATPFVATPSAKRAELAELIYSSSFHLTSELRLKPAKEIYEGIKNIVLSETIDISRLETRMNLIDIADASIFYANIALSGGWNQAKLLYPDIEDSVAGRISKFIFDVVLKLGLNHIVPPFGTLYSASQDLKDAIKLISIDNDAVTMYFDALRTADIISLNRSPFKLLEPYRSTINGIALMGTRNADIIRNFAPGAELSGGQGNDWMYSANIITVMSGEGGHDYLFGGSKDDVLAGGSGNDELRGGGGQDIARFSGNRANYDIQWDSAKEWLTVSSSADGRDRVYRDIESLDFRDGTLATSDIEAPSRNLAPVLAGNIEDQVAFAGERFEYYIPSNIFVDPDGDTLTWRVSGLPSWLNFNSNTRLLSGTPTTNDLGRKWINVSVTGSSDSETFTLLIYKRNSPPVVTVPSAPYNVDGDGGWISLSEVSVTDVDSDSLIVVVGVKYGQLRATGTIVQDLDVSSANTLSDAVGFRKSRPNSINAALATLEYRPANDWDSGRDVLVLLVTDSRVETPVFGFTSIYLDTKPVFSGSVSNQTYTVGTEISNLMLPAATDGQTPLMYSLTPTVPGLTFTASTRTLSGTPTTAGTYSMIYKVTDASSNTNTETFTITVAGTGVATDFNSDGRVNIDDFLLFSLYYGLSQGDEGYDARYDLDGNGTIGVDDFLIFANSYGTI